jgi:hypothetical protein
MVEAGAPIWASTDSTGVFLQPRRGIDVSIFVPVLADVCRDVQNAFGPNVWLEPVDTVERPFSYLMRARISDKGSVAPRSHIFIKLGKVPESQEKVARFRDRAANDYVTMQQLYAHLSTSAEFGTVRPIGCYPSHLAIVTEQVEGVTLFDRLRHDMAWWPTARATPELRALLERTGRWIRAFQEAIPPSEPQKAPAMEPYIDDRLRPLAKRYGAHGAAVRERVLAMVRTLSSYAGQSDVTLTPVHADLSPSNVLVTPSGRVVVLDFAMTRLGHPLQDVARLFTQLDLLRIKPRYRARAIDDLQHALLYGFDPELSPLDAGFRLQVLAQRINHLATLTHRRFSVLEGAYNWLVRRNHWQWIEAALATPPQEPSRWA